MRRSLQFIALVAVVFSLVGCAWLQRLFGPTYAVCYAGHGNTGGTEPDTKMYPGGATVTVAGPGSLVKIGHSFSEWNTSADGASTERFAPGATFKMPTEIVWLWAQWEAIQYTIAYVDNGSTGGTVPDSSTHAYGELVTIATAGSLVKTDYCLAGWNTAPDGSGSAYDPREALTMPAEDLTLYAQWTPGDPILTVAGVGSPGYSGDGGPATSARLFSPDGIAVDGAGSIYIADSVNHRIRKVDASGIMSTVAGTGEAGYSGDGGQATSAQLYGPKAVALDGAGKLYIADYFNHRIRMIDGSGTISTVAGSATFGYFGDGGPATSATLYCPSGVMTDGAGNLYIADTSNHCIRKVDASGVISTIAGTGSFGYSGDGGPAISAELYYPKGMALDGVGNLYIADGITHCIRKVDAAGTISTFAGTGESGFSGDGGPASAAQLSWPSGVIVDDARIVYIADSSNYRIRAVDITGTIVTVAGTGTWGYSGDGGPPAAAEIYNPQALAMDGAGFLYIADSSNHCIRVMR